MTGLRLMNLLMDPAEREATLRAHTSSGRAGGGGRAGGSSAADDAIRSGKVRTDLPIPPAPYLTGVSAMCATGRGVELYINPFMLYGRHLGYKGISKKNLLAHNEKALELVQGMEALKAGREIHEGEGGLAFFEAERDGTRFIYSPGGESPMHTFQFGGSFGRMDCASAISAGSCGRAPRSCGVLRRDGGGGDPGAERSEEWSRAAIFLRRMACRLLAVS